MKKINIFISLFVFSIIGFSFLSCDKIDEDKYLTEVDLGTKVDPEEIENKNKTQKILIEDFTGMRCLGCPDAAVAAQAIMSGNSNVFLIAIHSGSLSEPQQGYPNDFRTEEGTELRDYYKPSAYPAGMINRIEAPNTSVDTWASKVSEIDGNTPLIYMTLAKSSFDTVKNEVVAKITANYHQGYIDNLNLVLAITEDEIVAPQRMQDGSRNPEYIHNHMLRQMPDGAWGTPFVSDSINMGDSYALRKTFILRDSLAWENCHLVAYFIKNNTEKREIVQVEQIALKDILK